MHKVITFLGTHPRETRYSFNSQVVTGTVFAEAMCQLLEFDQMLVCATPEAKINSASLKCWQDPRVIPIAIPTARSTGEMWQLFDRIVEEVKDGDEVTFDITHGLRSLPFLVFLFAAYLRTARSVTIRAIYYGALELAGENEGIAPVLDLTEFLVMFDWLAGAEDFTRHGDSRRLAELIRTKRNDLGRNRTTKGRFVEGEQLNAIAAALEEISLGLAMIRPNHVMAAAADYPSQLKMGEDTLQQIPDFHPFVLLLESHSGAYRQMALKSPAEPESLADTLSVERTMIRWYVDHEQYVQAITLAREWMVSWLMVHLGYDTIQIKAKRKEVEERLNGDAYRCRSGSVKAILKKPKDPAPAYDQALALWSQITDIRNDIDHAGMSDNPKEAKNMRTNIQKIPDALDALPLPDAGHST